MITEIWEPIKGYEEIYEISNLGRVKSLARLVPSRVGRKRMMKERINKSYKDRHGYPTLSLRKGNKGKTFFVHRLVATTFIPNPDNKKTVNHKDGIKTNSSWDNLEWMTDKENNRHSWRTGLRNSDGVRKKVSQIKNNKVIKVWESQMAAGKALGILNTSISMCCSGITRSSGGFQWKII